jgi:hypothetical protein
VLDVDGARAENAPPPQPGTDYSGELSVSRLRLLALACAVLALAGCGTVVRLAYNNADYALRVAAHEWFDLHGEQSDLARVRIEAFHTWHRHNELPAYERLFDGAADRVARGLTREDVQWAIDAVRARYRVLATQAVGEIVPVVATFTPANFEALERKMAEGNERLEKDVLKIDPAKRDRNRFKTIAGRFEEWLGPLTAEQEELVRAFVRGGAAMVPVMLDDRRRRQRELLRLLETYRTRPDLRERLTAYVLDVERARGAEYARLAQAREAELVQLVLDLDRTMTPKQRAHAVAKLRSYARDFQVLAGQGRSEPQGGLRTAVPSAAGGS